MNRLSNDDRARVLACLVEGNSIRATVRITGIAKKTVARLGQPPSLPLAREALALRFEVTLPMREPMLISFPQCGQFMPNLNLTVSYVSK